MLKLNYFIVFIFLLPRSQCKDSREISADMSSAVFAKIDYLLMQIGNRQRDFHSYYQSCSNGTTARNESNSKDMFGFRLLKKVQQHYKFLKELYDAECNHNVLRIENPEKGAQGTEKLPYEADLNQNHPLRPPDNVHKPCPKITKNINVVGGDVQSILIVSCNGERKPDLHAILRNLASSSPKSTEQTIITNTTTGFLPPQSTESTAVPVPIQQKCTKPCFPYPGASGIHPNPCCRKSDEPENLE